MDFGATRSKWDHLMVARVCASSFLPRFTREERGHAHMRPRGDPNSERVAPLFLNVHMAYIHNKSQVLWASLGMAEAWQRGVLISIGLIAYHEEVSVEL